MSFIETDHKAEQKAKVQKQRNQAVDLFMVLIEPFFFISEITRHDIKKYVSEYVKNKRPATKIIVEARPRSMREQRADV